MPGKIAVRRTSNHHPSGRIGKAMTKLSHVCQLQFGRRCTHFVSIVDTGSRCLQQPLQNLATYPRSCKRALRGQIF